MFDPEQLFNQVKAQLLVELAATDLTEFIHSKERHASFFAFFESLRRLEKQYESIMGKKMNKHEMISEESPLLTDVGNRNVSLEGTIESKLEKNNELSIREKRIQAYRDYYNSNQPTPRIEPIPPIQTIEKKKYVFIRLAWGGKLENLDTVITEDIVQSNGFEHGDILYADPMPYIGGKKRYFFSLAQKAVVLPSNHERILIEMCVVEKKDGFFTVERSLKTGETINLRYNDIPITVKLQDWDIYHYNLTEGDVINIAYLIGDEQSVRVVYKHEIHDRALSKPSKKTVKQKGKRYIADEDKLVDQDIS